MKLRTRIFLLSTATALAATAAAGTAGLASGGASIVAAAASGLERELESYSSSLEAAWGATRDIGDAFPADAAPASSPASRLAAFLRGGEARSFVEGAGVELFLPSGERLFAPGARAAEAAGALPEVAAAARSGPAYVLRREERRPVLYFAAPIRLGGVDLVARVSAGMEALDLFRGRQLLVLGAACALAAALLLAASYLISRAITRGTEELARRATAFAAGGYAARAEASGSDEVASLARSFNAMADAIQGEMARLEAEKADRQAFIDDLTHELRTPVTSIVGFAELLRSRAWDEELFRDCLERIGAEGRRILELTEGLKRLLLARTAARAFEAVEARELLEAAAAEARPALEAKGMRAEVEAAPGAIRCDRALIAMALRNLVDNAIRASGAGSRLVLGYRPGEAGPRLSVRDFGPGMRPEDLARAGKPFRRAASQADEGGKAGLGLGLAICEEIAAGHGARLVLESPEGGGLEASIAFENLQAVYAGDAPALPRSASLPVEGQEA